MPKLTTRELIERLDEALEGFHYADEEFRLEHLDEADYLEAKEELHKSVCNAACPLLDLLAECRDKIEKYKEMLAPIHEVTDRHSPDCCCSDCDNRRDYESLDALLAKLPKKE